MPQGAPIVGPHVQCSVCRLVMRVPEPPRWQVRPPSFCCTRCGARVHRRKPDSLARTTAFLLAAVFCYFPANLYPIMKATSLGRAQEDTILTGVVYLAENGMWPLAAIVFVASVVVPVAKIVSLTGLVLSVRWKSRWRPRDRAATYRIVELVGRWSMVDVYVVTILVALVHMGTLANVEVRFGAVFFAAVVVLTIFAAESFDPRLIWDALEERDGREARAR
ncbi:MAG: paraquat-inducible protein A [Myxococcota bacterium]